jgi:acyl-coenzyme A synthetase/AMP-(fatty) acid ligase
VIMPDRAAGSVPGTVGRVKELIKVRGHQVAPAELEALLAWVAERVAPYKRVLAVRFADAIPRTPSDKLLRRALADQLHLAVY